MKILLLIIALLAAAGAAIGIWMNIDAPDSPEVLSKIQVNSAASQNTNSTSGPVQIYVVAVDDGGKTGRMFGCNDSLINMTRTVENPTLLSSALRALFDYNSSETTAFTVLNNATFTIDQATVENGIATVKLSGTYELAGTCDGPRFVEQIKQTVIDFPGVETANITVNDKTLDEAVSTQ